MQFTLNITFLIYKGFQHLYNVCQSYPSTITSLQYPLVPPVHLPPNSMPSFCGFDNLPNRISAGHVLIGWGVCVHSRLILSSSCWLGTGFSWVCKIRHQTQNTAPAEAMLISLILFVLPSQPYNCSSHGNFKRGKHFSCALTAEAGIRWNKKKNPEHHFSALFYKECYCLRWENWLQYW